MLDEYSRQRLDSMVVDVAVTRSKVEAIELSLSRMCEQSDVQGTRLLRLERRVFTIWVLGPILLGAATFLHSFKTWLLER